VDILNPARSDLSHAMGQNIGDYGAGEQTTLYGAIRSLAAPFLVLATVWLATIALVNPVGEFMINDDWSFVRLLQSLLWHGELAATGWGRGGPAAIAHILWGGLFTAVGGFSLTTLRLSVLFLGVLGSFSFLVLLRLCGASPWVALLGTLTLVLNPLFLSQCFTFMTDITFASLIVFSLLFLHLGEQRGRKLLIAVGLLFGLAAILTRQIGIVIPVAFIIMTLAHPHGMRLGRLKMCALAAIICFVPWIGFEGLLYGAGSTPVTQHQVVANILEKPLNKGLIIFYHYARLLVLTLGYTALFVTPLLALSYYRLWSFSAFRLFVCILAFGFVVVEAAITAGLVDPPVKLHQNVIFDFGIGPILLKDTYIIGIQRLSSIPKTAYYAMAFWGLLACGVLLALAYSSLAQWVSSLRKDPENATSFIGTLSLVAALIYGGVTIFTGSFDRDFIPLLIFIMVWLCADVFRGLIFPLNFLRILPCLIPLIIMAVLIPLMVSDFMSFKRCLTVAHEHITKGLHVDPCGIDEGFEFNGYHCYKKDFHPRVGLSWWWVDREDYLVTLGPLPGYKVVRTFPFARYVGKDGAVHVLKSDNRSDEDMNSHRSFRMFSGLLNRGKRSAEQ